MSAAIHDHLPTTLADLLSITLILRQTAPYLTVSALHNLSRSCKTLHHVILESPIAFRYLDLSPVKSALVPLDGINWHAERMDKALTEDDFYSGPLRNIFSALEQQRLLCNIRTLVLDGLSVTAELVKELLTEEKYNLRILSIREVKHLNERKLQQYIRYAVRPSRPVGTPQIQGLYLFGPRDSVSIQQPPRSRSPIYSISRGVMSSQGAQIGAEWNQKSSEALHASLATIEDKWFQSSGKMISKRPSPEWAEILQACEGIISFDAVLCRGPRHDPNKAFMREGTTDGHLHPGTFLRPTIATVALGPTGCESCHSCPEGPAIFGKSSSSHFPLLSPVPLHQSSLRAAQVPHTLDKSAPRPLFARCEDCLKGRWCERCHKWWDEECYTGSVTAQRTELQQTELTESIQHDGTTHLIPKQTIKQRHVGVNRSILACKRAQSCEHVNPRMQDPETSLNTGLQACHLDDWTMNETSRAKIIGVRRDCFGCGHTCISCKELLIRTCRKCKYEYCYEEDDASSETMCDWCNYTSRRTLHMY